MWLQNSTLKLIFLCLYATHLANGYLRPSSPGFEHFIRAESSIVAGLGRYVQHEADRLDVIRNSSGYENEIPIVEERIKLLKEFHEEAAKNASAVTDDIRALRVNHPTSALAAIKNFVLNWEPLFLNETKYGFRLQEFLNVSKHDVVGREDIFNIHGDIVFIHLFYNLTARDIYQGNILGVKGEPMTIEDAFAVALHAKETTKLRVAEEWFEHTLNESKKHDNKTNVNLPLLLSELSLLYSEFGEKEKAISFATEAFNLNETNEVIYLRFVRMENEFVTPMKNFDNNAPAYWKNLTELCQSNSTFPAPMKWYHRCRLRCSPNPLRRYKEEILSISPYVSVFYNIIDDETIEDLKNTTAKTLSSQDHFLYSNFHSSEMLNETTGSARLLTHLAADISGLNASFNTGRSKPSASPLRVLKFGFAGRAKPHHQFSMIDNRLYGAGLKIATVMYYLTDVEHGGATVFMDLGIRYQPKKGSALLMYLTRPSGEDDNRLTKAECALAVGSKWMLEKDIYFKRNKMARPCARKRLGNEIGLERMVHKFRHCGF